MNTLEQHNPKIEVYSVDEAFIDLSGVPHLLEHLDAERGRLLLLHAQLGEAEDRIPDFGDLVLVPFDGLNCRHLGLLRCLRERQNSREEQSRSGDSYHGSDGYYLSMLEQQEKEYIQKQLSEEEYAKMNADIEAVGFFGKLDNNKPQ